MFLKILSNTNISFVEEWHRSTSFDFLRYALCHPCISTSMANKDDSVIFIVLRHHHTASGSILYTSVISSHSVVNSSACRPCLPP